jgi:short subunit dehydrogenase-like uncharacterized protein
MKFLLLLASALTAMAAGLAVQTAAAEPCDGPFAHCARAVVAQCARDPDGVQRMTYWDFTGRTTQFERCVGQVYEARGLPNPYKTGEVGNDELPLPRSEILFPNYNN